ncbi:hypothetical protein RB12223 [Rhodopirellula baltica SH 1]|uniref:Uncharacterized protein n=1 Tax=Rhodopirellula baltica (strain DSM 10527 / NCIMB 13988 / SH1) TaxID=243090 RepID=Q7UIZ9_RHOBA|nr:hypothetical protein RB12223 [Rhodopirellula baltica SH 1]
MVVVPVCSVAVREFSSTAVDAFTIHPGKDPQRCLSNLFRIAAVPFGIAVSACTSSTYALWVLPSVRGSAPRFSSPECRERVRTFRLFHCPRLATASVCSFSTVSNRSTASGPNALATASTNTEATERSSHFSIWCKHWCKRSASPRFAMVFWGFFATCSDVDIVEVTDSSSVSPTPKNPVKTSVLRGFFVSASFSASSSVWSERDSEGLKLLSWTELGATVGATAEPRDIEGVLFVGCEIVVGFGRGRVRERL